MAAFALVSCAKDAEGDVAKAPRKSDQVIALSPAAGEQALDNRYASFKDDIKLNEQGGFAGGTRSQYDGKRNVAFGGGVGTASYRKPSYSAQEWSGRTAASTKRYSGDTDGSRFQTASRFQGTSAVQTAQRSRFSGKQARQSTYKTNRASENASERLDKPVDARTDFRRRVYSQPLIIDDEDLTVEQTRSILGRD